MQVESNNFMIIRKINDDVSIACESYSNSRAWGHRAMAIYKGREVERASARYYNRTWERYQFESVMLGLVDKLDKTKAIPLEDRVAMYQNIKA